MDFPPTTDARLSVLSKIIQPVDNPGLGLQASKRADGSLEVRLDAPNKGTHVFPVRWSNHPARKDFADPAQRSGFRGIYLAASIAEPLANDLRTWQVCHADLNGRLFLVGDGFFVDRQPRGNRFRNPVAEPKLFTPKASRIIRALVANRDAKWDQDSLVSTTRTSRGYVSRILKTLVADGFIRHGEPGNRKQAAQYEVVDFDRLLDSWAEADRFASRVERVEFSLLVNDPIAVAKEVCSALDGCRFAFTQWIAAWLRKPHTTPPVVSVYVTAEAASSYSAGRQVSSGGNLWLLVPKDVGVFQNLREERGFPLVCDPQIYLDLIGSGLRGPEAAEALRKAETFSRSS